MVGRGFTRQEWVSTGALRSAHSYRSSPEAFRPWGNTLQTPRAGPSRSCPALCVCPCPLHLAGLGSPPLLLLRLLQACPGAATLCLVLLSFCAEFPLALGLQRRPECCPPWVPAGPVGPLLSVSLEPAGVAAVAFALRVGQFLPQLPPRDPRRPSELATRGWCAAPAGSRGFLPLPGDLRLWGEKWGAGAGRAAASSCGRGGRSSRSWPAERGGPRAPAGKGGAPGGAVPGPLPSSGARGPNACRQPNRRPGAFIGVTTGAPVGHPPGMAEARGQALGFPVMEVNCVCCLQQAPCHTPPERPPPALRTLD